MNPAHAPSHLPSWKLRHGRVREANFFREQEHRGKNRERMRSVSRIPRAEENGPKYIAPSFGTRRTSEGGDLGAAVPSLHRVIVKARPQVLALPDVEDLPPGVRHQVYARLSRERFPPGEGAHRLPRLELMALEGEQAVPDLGRPLEVEPPRRLLHPP